MYIFTNIWKHVFPSCLKTLCTKQQMSPTIKSNQQPRGCCLLGWEHFSVGEFMFSMEPKQRNRNRAVCSTRKKSYIRSALRASLFVRFVCENTPTPPSTRRHASSLYLFAVWDVGRSVCCIILPSCPAAAGHHTLTCGNLFPRGFSFSLSLSLSSA